MVITTRRLRGEAFYDGRPTSYWRQEFDRWQRTVGYGRDASGKEHRTEFWVREQNWLEVWFDKEERGEAKWPNPRSDGVKAAALPVLQELVDDESFRVQRLANYWMRALDDDRANTPP